MEDHKADFLFGADSHIDELGYEFANGETEDYLKEVWESLKQEIRKQAISECKNAQCLGVHPSGEADWDVQAVKRIDEKVKP